jgi:hypothetical protein
MIGSADQAWKRCLRGHQAAQTAAAQLRRRLLEKLGALWLLTDRVLRSLAAALILVAVLGFWLALGAHIGAPSPAGAANPVVMFKSPQNPTLWLCNKNAAGCKGEGHGHLTINEEVSGIPSGVGLGSFEFVIYYWGNIVNVSVTEGPFLASTGRETYCTTTPGVNLLRFRCVSTGSNTGPSGSGILAYIEVKPDPDLVLRPTAGNGVSMDLFNSSLDAELADAMGNRIPIQAVGSSQILVRALEGDVNYDCIVNVIDEQALSVRYGTSFGILPYDTFFDLEPISPDFDIDIKDLQFVYGRDHSSCEVPVPPGPTSTPTPGPTSTSTPGPPETATPTPSAGTPATPTASPTAGTPSPSATPRKHTKTPTPTGGTPTPGGSPTPGTATSTPMSETVPIERTPVPGRTPGTAEGLPGAGSGSHAAAPDGYLPLLIAMLAMWGWSILTGMLYCRQTRLSEQPVKAERERPGPARRF